MSKKVMKKIDINADAWNQLHNLRKELKYKKWSGVILWLLKHQSLQGEKTQQKIKGMDALHEIHSHVDKIRLPQEPALSKLSVMDTPHTLKDQDHVSDTDKTLWISCPVCYSIKPLIVEVDPDGNPLKKHEDGIEYKMVGGVLQRRFSGPDDNYLPFQIQTGSKVIVEESMAISTLRRLNKKLFDDFTNTLKNTTHKFTGGMW